MAATALRQAERVTQPAVPAEAPPEALANFHWAAPDSLSPQRQQALMAAPRRTPRPAAAWQQLMSPQFLTRAKLAPRLALPDPGAMVAQVLLSFLGHLGATSLLLHPPGAQPTSGDLLARCRQSQDELGLTPAKIGGLLLREWRLPETLIHEVCSIDRLPVTPAEAIASRRNQSLAVAYLCARLGERLTVAPTDLAGFNPRHATGEDSFHLRGYLASSGLARLNDHLHGPDVLRCLQALHPPQFSAVDA